jgi:hypothetical protein
VARRRRSGDSIWSALAPIGAVVGTIGVVAILNRRSASAAAPRRVALIGDSYAVGLGPELAKLLPNFKYEGHVGIGTSAWVDCAACAPWLPDYQPTTTLVSLGANDGTAPDPTAYQAIVRALHGIGSQVVWIEPPAGLANRSAVRAAIASLGIPTVPATQTALGPDGVHPQSYAPWAAEIARAVG